MRYTVLAFVILFAACQGQPDNTQKANAVDSAAIPTDSTANPGTAKVASTGDSLPAPFSTPSVENYCKIVGWPNGQTPMAPSGFTVTNFATGLDNPRFIYVADNGDVFVAEANTQVNIVKRLGAKLTAKGKSQNLGQSANRITLFRTGPNGLPVKKYTFLKGLNQPFGILVIGPHFYVANTDGLMEYDYTSGDTVAHGQGRKIVNLPAGGYNNHWTRNITTTDQKDRIYISVGSGSNVGEHGLANEVRRADILQVNLDGSGEKIYASGLRNPAGLSIQPESKTLWAAVNERDELGDDLVPDYITSVKEGGFYGWPYSYFGNHPDPRMSKDPRPDMVSRAIVPDYPVGAHTASLGFTFYTGNTFPRRYRNGAFIGQHGSWNRSQLAGYKVAFVPFRNGMPAGPMEDFLTGFLVGSGSNDAHGRPVGLAVMKDGSLLVADDAGNTIWKVTATNNN